MNLWKPADGPGGRDFGAHGRFSDRAHTFDPQLVASRHHGMLAAAVGGVLAATAWAARSARR